MEEGKKNKWCALAVTLVVHLAMLLLLLFYTLAAPVIPENDGSGVVLQLGVIDAEAGTFRPTATPPQVVQSEPEPIVTQDIEETVSLDEEKIEKNRVQPEKELEVQPEPETETVDNLWSEALSKGKKADSLAREDDKKGSLQGTAESAVLVGSPGYGDYDLGGRGLIGRLPKPEYTGTNDEGTIVVEVLVDAQGRVVQANVTPSGSVGTAASNTTLRSRAEAAARKAVFERKASGNENQWGSITYYFKQN